MGTHYSNCVTSRKKKHKSIKNSWVYQGPSKDTVMSSITARDRSIPYLGEYQYLRSKVLKAKRRFAEVFYIRVDTMKKNERVDLEFVEGCKRRHKELSDLISRIIDADPDLKLFFLVGTAKGLRPTVYQLTDVKYVPQRFIIKGLDMFDDVVDVYIHESQPKLYASLFKVSLEVALACRDAMDWDDDLAKSLRDLALSILEIGGLYNEFNPDDEQWLDQELSTLALLENDANDTYDPEIDTLLQHVLEDIREGRKPYVQEISRAIRATRQYRKSPFSRDDYYFSMKSDAAYIPGFRYKQSLIKSALETDPLKGCSFDLYTGYNGHYNENAPEGYHAPLVKTIHIPNSGKFKSRPIHLGISSVQDRCCYIHNRILAVLRRMQTDCTKYQSRGHAFTKKITDPTYREDRKWPSVLAYDWTSATDKMLPAFQEECLRLLFDEPIVEFWHTISSCEKEFHFRNGSRKTYVQKTGQPQGLLGSFDAFTWAHHIIMLMTMSLTGREMYDSLEFYRVLGDDSIICSITEDKPNLVGDSYIRICQWANMDINRSKSTEITFDKKTALVDFAKVQILNGEYFSPIPGRLANRIGQHDIDYYAFSAALWYGNHGYFKPDWIESLIKFYYKDEVDYVLARKFVTEGVLPAFREVGYEFFDPKDKVRLAMCISYAINKVRSSFLMTLMSDAVKENLALVSAEIQKDGLSELIPPDLQEVWDKIEDSDHKLLLAVEENLFIEDTIKFFLEASDDQAKVISANLKLTVDEYDALVYLVELLEVCTMDSTNLEFFYEDILRISETLKILERFNYRSVYKRNAVDIMVMRRSIDTFKSLFPDLVQTELNRYTEEKELLVTMMETDV
nr:RNA-dependent RNA polymerase [Mute swan feces associated narna-like virus 4]